MSWWRTVQMANHSRGKMIRTGGKTSRGWSVKSDETSCYLLFIKYTKRNIWWGFSWWLMACCSGCKPEYRRRNADSGMLTIANFLVRAECRLWLSRIPTGRSADYSHYERLHCLGEHCQWLPERISCCSQFCVFVAQINVFADKKTHSIAQWCRCAIVRTSVSQ